MFVIYENEMDCKDMIELRSFTSFENFMYNFFGTVPASKSLCLNGNVLKIERAAEPLDIIWENLETPFINKYMHRILGILINILILCMSFGLIFASAYL